MDIGDGGQSLGNPRDERWMVDGMKVGNVRVKGGDDLVYDPRRLDRWRGSLRKWSIPHIRHQTWRIVG